MIHTTQDFVLGSHLLISFHGQAEPPKSTRVLWQFEPLECSKVGLESEVERGLIRFFGRGPFGVCKSISEI